VVVQEAIFTLATVVCRNSTAIAQAKARRWHPRNPKPHPELGEVRALVAPSPFEVKVRGTGAKDRSESSEVGSGHRGAAIGSA